MTDNSDTIADPGTIKPLVDEAWQLYDRAKQFAEVVEPSLPVLFFGDSVSYFRSPLKVITVGLNPSRLEFPEGAPYSRFEPAQHVYPGILRGQHYSDYLDALNGYFRRNPYSRWFSAFEPILNGMECSYYGSMQNSVLHTDLCSPLATNPTWSRLPPTPTKRAMTADGSSLWLRLVRYLTPDVILISVARHYLEILDFPVLGDWNTLYVVERENPYRVEVRKVGDGDGNTITVVFGPASQTPFGKVSTIAKAEIGRSIEKYAHS